MLAPPETANKYLTPLPSPWDGDLAFELRTWGYRELPSQRDDLCDFGPGQHELQTAFAALGMDTRGVGEGGSNQCFHVEHANGRAVERGRDGRVPEVERQTYVVGGVRYRVTQSYTTLAINPAAGALFFLNRLSPAHAAAESWGLAGPEAVRREWLPALASSSDIAWGFWNRACSANLHHITKIFSCMITNEVTLELIDEALRTYPLAPGESRPLEVEKWPGTTFPVRFDAALALLGSPNGVAAGYFLAQHKAQLGGNKFIERVTVFRPDRGLMPYLLFWVEDAPAGPGEAVVDEKMGRDGVEPRIVKRSVDGKNVEREHVLRAKL
ncbi:hypothetical protein P153DRAFT_300869 [Dothidotthia symphoricarpi CBS 119687]|uniref:Uncharacterized protein n=1 Tax=Dothidotthia symphoricarpi CBS 119687 TaxID=1392245 RepID=A0A6A6A018_9PLEO|nr:uncharacterized protein P153DRAFT_300869 [Dothidotthia symphoricarpi CBS 119687]KAF2125169.1 hypothetical protein P153DRAFT_300869 [Dothidotthia symphoricarpi CBS 119687]